MNIVKIVVMVVIFPQYLIIHNYKIIKLSPMKDSPQIKLYLLLNYQCYDCKSIMFRKINNFKLVIKG